MKLSAPIYRLKRQAKLLSREQNIPLHQALDQLASNEGYQRWSHLAAAATTPSLPQSILSGLKAGDMLLLAARPGQGKTLVGLEIAVSARRQGMNSLFFTLDYTEEDVAKSLRNLEGVSKADVREINVDTSNEICADYIVDTLKAQHGPSIAIIDYLQLLDQRRSTPDLDQQLAQLKRHAECAGDIIVAISQIDRAFEASGRSVPDLSDVRLPNPVDLGRFNSACFLHNGEATLSNAPL